MNNRIAIGLVMLSLPLLATLLRVCAELQRISQTTPTCRTRFHPLHASPQTQLVYAVLPEAVENEVDPNRSGEAIEDVGESVSDAVLSAKLDSLALDASPGTDEMSLFRVRRWAEFDPRAAAAWASQLPESPVRHAAFEQVAIAWADSDVPAAVEWLNALSEGESRQTATLALAYEAARTEPLVALELGCALPPTRERDDLLVHAVSQWHDSTAAAAWATKVLEPNLQHRLIAAVAVASAEQDGAAAATLAANALGAGEEQNRAAVSIVQRWAQNSPQAAASWVALFPNIPSRDGAVQNLLAIWTAQNPEAAGDWLRKLPAGSMRDVGVSAYAQALGDRDRSSPLVPPAEAEPLQ